MEIGNIKVPLKKVSNFTSLASYPSNFRIFGQDKDEFIFLFIRESRVILFLNLILLIVLGCFILFVPIIFNFLNSFFFKFDIVNIENFFSEKYWTVIIIMWFTYISTMYFDTMMRWFYNINILTNKRFIDFGVLGLFTNKVEETNLMNIQDVKDKQTNILQSLFNIGNLEVFTASGSTLYNLPNVYMSHKVRDFINDVIIDYAEKFKNDS